MAKRLSEKLRISYTRKTLTRKFPTKRKLPRVDSKIDKLKFESKKLSVICVEVFKGRNSVLGPKSYVKRIETEISHLNDEREKP